MIVGSCCLNTTKQLWKKKVVMIKQSNSTSKKQVSLQSHHNLWLETYTSLTSQLCPTVPFS